MTALITTLLAPARLSRGDRRVDLLDARHERLDNRVATALPEARSTRLRSIRRQQVEARWQLLYRLVNYRTGLPYDWRPELVILAGVVTAVAIVYANNFLGFPVLEVSIAAVFVGFAVVRGLFGWQQRLLANRLFRQLPDAIELVRSAVQSGVPVNEAFRTIAEDMPQPTAGQFAIVCNEIRLGRPADEAIDGVYQRMGVTEYAMFAVALAVQMKSGGRLGETLLSLGDSVRQRVALAARAKALAGEVIFSARALSVSPLLLGGLLYWINPRLVDRLFTDPTGKKLLAFAIVSIVVGTLVIRWMVKRETMLYGAPSLKPDGRGRTIAYWRPGRCCLSFANCTSDH